MRRLALLVLLLLLPALPIQSQNAPGAINRALDDLSGWLDENITLSDLENWTYAQQIYPDPSMGCPQPGVSYTQVLTDGYQFSLTYHGITADYRVSADQRFTILCNTEAIIELARPTCPPPNDPAYLPARLEIGTQGRVTAGGLPNNVRSQPGSSSSFLGEIPPGEVFTVLDGPQCSQIDKLVWWQVDYQGLIGWTASGQNGDYWVEPLDSPVPAVVPISAANVAQVVSVPMARNIQMVAALSPDGSRFATAVGNGVAVSFPRQPNVPGLMTNAETIPTTQTATTLAFDASGDRLAAGYPDGTMLLISTAPGDAITLILSIESGEAAINDLVFSPDGALLASAGTDANVSLWDSRSGASLAVLRGHVVPVVYVEFSADGSTILSRDESGIVILWQVGADNAVDFG